MAGEKKNAKGRPASRGDAQAPARGRATKIILAAAAVVVAATVYVIVANPWHAEPKPATRESLAERAENVRKNMESLIAHGDAVDPRGGPASLAQRKVAYEQAAELGKSFIQFADQRDVLVRPLLTKALLRLGRFDDAAKTVRALMKLAPNSAEAMCLQGELLEAQGQPGSLEWFRKAAQSPRAKADIFARYGTALLAAGEDQRAEAMLLKAYHAGSRTHPVLLGLALLEMRANKFDQAEPRLAELAARPGPSIRVLGWLAECQKENGHPDQAEKTLRQALSVHDAPELYGPLGDILEIQRKYAEAGEIYAKAASAGAAAAASFAADRNAAGAAEASAFEMKASFKAARAYETAGRYALAMKCIDRAAALVDQVKTGPDIRGEIARWQRKIEDDRFGPAPAAAGDSGFGSDLLLGPGGSGAAATGSPSDANSAQPTTKPGGLLDFKW